MKLSKAQSEKTYVLYGFCKSDIDEVGYLLDIPKQVEDLAITNDVKHAMRFSESNVDSAVRYINQEFIDLYKEHAYVFHKVRVIN